MDRASKTIPQIVLMVQPISGVFGKIKFIGIAFEDFKKFSKRLRAEKWVWLGVN